MKSSNKKRYNVLTCLCERRTRRQQKMTFLFKKWTSSYEYGLVCDTMMSIMWCGDMLTAYVIIFSILFFVNISWRVRQGQLWKKVIRERERRSCFDGAASRKTLSFFFRNPSLVNDTQSPRYSGGGGIHAKSGRYLRYISAIFFGFSAKF